MIATGQLTKSSKNASIKISISLVFGFLLYIKTDFRFNRMLLLLSIITCDSYTIWTEVWRNLHINVRGVTWPLKPIALSSRHTVFMLKLVTMPQLSQQKDVDLLHYALQQSYKIPVLYCYVVCHYCYVVS